MTLNRVMILSREIVMLVSGNNPTIVERERWIFTSTSSQLSQLRSKGTPSCPAYRQDLGYAAEFGILAVETGAG